MKFSKSANKMDGFRKNCIAVVIFDASVLMSDNIGVELISPAVSPFLLSFALIASKSLYVATGKALITA